MTQSTHPNVEDDDGIGTTPTPVPPADIDLDDLGVAEPTDAIFTPEEE
ncbi:minor tail protein [Microbacterium phage Smarties]|uniref:Minor tail protein n=1 Tax=Microbacterium phage Ariadne TaxID=2656546 RepID=A0A649VB73_9CAUD|nr:minor tail protein [Microbacterium phage Ariadne]QGJ89454.1 minor tail protein [Microbacterium phage Ariadne]QGJ91441.1 minor tail protein [Microbacterium phage Smarties]